MGYIEFSAFQSEKVYVLVFQVVVFWLSKPFSEIRPRLFSYSVSLDMISKPTCA